MLHFLSLTMAFQTAPHAWHAHRAHCGSRHTRSLPLLCAGQSANSTRVFDGEEWEAAAGPATRIAEIRRQQARTGGAAPGLPGKDTDWSAALERAATTRPLTLLLVLAFGVLTVGDVVFNLSRLFICLVPDMCTAAVY